MNPKGSYSHGLRRRVGFAARLLARELRVSLRPASQREPQSPRSSVYTVCVCARSAGESIRIPDVKILDTIGYGLMLAVVLLGQACVRRL